MYKRFNQIFEVTDGQPVKLSKKARSYDQMCLNVNDIITVTQHDDNIWNESEKLTIFMSSNGFGFEYEIPGGYSECTYDPEIISNFYMGADLEWFLQFGLDQNLREMLTDTDIEILNFAKQNTEYLE